MWQPPHCDGGDGAAQCAHDGGGDGAAMARGASRSAPRARVGVAGVAGVADARGRRPDNMRDKGATEAAATAVRKTVIREHTMHGMAYGG